MVTKIRGQIQSKSLGERFEEGVSKMDCSFFLLEVTEEDKILEFSLPFDFTKYIYRCCPRITSHI